MLSALVALCNFLTYGDDRPVARLHGAGQDARAGALAAAGAVARARAPGSRVAAVVRRSPSRSCTRSAATGDVADLAARYLRIGALGVPSRWSRSPARASCAA